MDRTTSRPCLNCVKPLNRQGKGHFCSTACKHEYHNRRARRGQLLYDVDTLMRKRPADTKTWAARRAALYVKWDREDEAAGRKMTTRPLSDVSYDNDFPREYELPAYGVDPD